MYRKTNEVFVADGYGNHRTIVFDADTGLFKRMWGAFGNKPIDDDHCPAAPAPPITKDGTPGPQQFAIVHAARVSNDGLVYVADREHRRVQVFSIAGKYIAQFFVGCQPETGGASVVAFSAEPAQRFLYVGGGSLITVVDRKTLGTKSSFGGKGVWAESTTWPSVQKGTSNWSTSVVFAPPRVRQTIPQSGIRLPIVKQERRVRRILHYSAQFSSKR